MRRLNPLDVYLRVPTNAPDKFDSVIVLHCGLEVQTDTNRLLQPEFSSETLHAFDGELHGGLRFGPGKKTDDYIIGWSNLNQSVTWPVRLNHPANYEVSINYDVTDDSADGAFSVTLASHALTGTVSPGGPTTMTLGTVSLPSDSFGIRVSALKIRGGELFRLRSLVLKPLVTEQAPTSP